MTSGSRRKSFRTSARTGWDARGRQLRTDRPLEVSREAAERAVGRQQLPLGAALDDPALFHNEDLVRAADRREPGRDDQRRAAVQEAVEGALDQNLGRPVDVRRRLVEYQDPRVREQRARD